MNENNNKGSKQKASIGMDLGTTYSAVAIFKVNGNKAEIIPNEIGERTTPSVVYYSKEGQILVGLNAEKNRAIDGTRVVSEVKRKIGKEGKEGKVFIGENGEKVLTPEEVSSQIISYLVNNAADKLGVEIEGLVITVPAYFGDLERKATADAVEIAGFKLLKIINEPTAAAIAYGLDKKGIDSTILVYDLGGGTFDVSILKISSGGTFEVLSTAGDKMLGGIDFDKEVVELIKKNFERKNKINLNTYGDIKDQEMVNQRIRIEAEAAKRRLSNANEIRTRITIPFICSITDDKGKMSPLHLEDEIDRSTFEKITSKLLEKTKEKVNEALKNAFGNSNEVDKIDRVILVGGSTRMPMVEKLLSEMFGSDKINKSVNPDEVVAEGAAIQASIMTGGIKDILLLDITPLSLGIETEGDAFQDIVPRGTTMPATREQTFSTAADNQETVSILVYEGERPKASDNKLLGRFDLHGIQKAKRGVPVIKVKFHVDSSGKLSVSAKDEKTGVNHSITVQSINLSKEEIARMKKEAELNKEADDALRNNHSLLNNANAYLHEFEKQKEEFERKKVSAEDENYVKFLKLYNNLEKSVDEKDYVSLKKQLDEIGEMMKFANQISEEYKNKGDDTVDNNTEENNPSDDDKNANEEDVFDANNNNDENSQ